MLYSYFYAIGMDDVDIVLGYPWMDSVGTININAQKKNLKLSYKKNKIIMQDVSLSKKEGLTEVSKVVITESKVEYESKSIEIHEEKPKDRHNKEAKNIIESKAHHVAELKKK